MKNFHLNAYKVVKLALMLISLIVGIHAFYGGSLLLIDPSGKLLNLQQFLPDLPFGDNYFWFGIMLIVLNGFSQMVCFLLLLMHHHSGGVVASFSAAILLIWTSVQLVFLGWFFYSTLHLFVSIIQLSLGIWFNFLYQNTQKPNQLTKSKHK